MRSSSRKRKTANGGPRQLMQDGPGPFSPLAGGRGRDLSDLPDFTDFGYAFAPDQSGGRPGSFPEEGMTIFHKSAKKKKITLFKKARKRFADRPFFLFVQ